MTEKDKMNYLKYHSNGDLDKINNHSCICCKKLRNDIDIFVFTDNSVEHTWPTTITPNNVSGLVYPQSSIFQGQNEAFRPAKKNTIFICAKCLYRLSQKISEEDIAKMVVDEI